MCKSLDLGLKMLHQHLMLRILFFEMVFTGIGYAETDHITSINTKKTTLEMSLNCIDWWDCSTDRFS